MTELNRTAETRTGVAADAMTASLLHEAGAWAKTQGALLSGIEAIWAEWIERRREAIDAAARSLQEMCACRSVADLARIQQQWLAGAVHRAACDAAALANGAAAMTRLAAEGPAGGAAHGRVSPVRAEPQRQAAE